MHNTILKMFRVVHTSDGKHHVVAMSNEITKGMAVVIPDPKTKKLIFGEATRVDTDNNFIQVHDGARTLSTYLDKAMPVALKHEQFVNCGIVLKDRDNSREKLYPAYHDMTFHDLEKITKESDGYCWLEMGISDRTGKVEHVSGKRLVPRQLHGRHLIHFYEPQPEPVAALH
jgi:hypothetical protein